MGNPLFDGRWRDKGVIEARRKLYPLRGQKELGWGDMQSWYGSYALVSLCEYYLLTGDSAVLDVIETTATNLAKGQMACGSWGHSSPGSGYGAVNQVGLICVMALALAREAGVDNAAALDRSMDFFSRCTARNIPYGDHATRPQRYNQYQPVGSNGRAPELALVWHLLGSDELAGPLAQMQCYQYRTLLAGHAARIFPLAWGPAGARLASADEFHMFMNNVIWSYELSRQANGSFVPLHGKFDGGDSTVAMAFALPAKRLRVLGAPKSVFARKAPADLAEAKTLFSQKKWAALKTQLSDYSGPNQVYAKDLLEAYQRVEKHYQATLLLIKDQISKNRQSRAKEYLDDLKVYIGEDRQELTALARQLGAPQETPSPTEKQQEPVAKEIKAPEKWDRLLSGKHPDQSGGEAGIRTRVRRTFRAEHKYEVLRVTTERYLKGSLYLNGKRVAYFNKSSRGDGVRTFDLGANAAALIKQGDNLLEARVIDQGGQSEILLELAAGPGKIDIQVVKEGKPAFEKYNNRGGWKPDRERVWKNSRWFFEGKDAKAIARYIAHPDCGTAQMAVEALAGKGKAVIPLLEQLIADSHPGIRMGAWDTFVKLYQNGALNDTQKQAFLDIAVKRAPTEDSWVLYSLSQAIKELKLKTPQALAITQYIARSSDPYTSQRAADFLEPRRGIMKTSDPVFQITAVTAILSHLKGADPRMLGNAMKIIATNYKLPEARAAVPKIAQVLDEVSHEQRGMFSNGPMTHAIRPIEYHLDAQLEKTPQLISGLVKCYIKGPHTNWPGWPIAHYKIKKVIYKLSPSAAPEIRRVSLAQQQWLNKNSDEQIAYIAGTRELVQMDIDEMLLWANALRDTSATQILKMARSSEAMQRKVAVSVAWAGRVESTDKQIEIAIAVADNVKGNDSRHWRLAWEILGREKKNPAVANALPVIAKVFDQRAHSLRGWQGVWVYLNALPVIEAYLTPETEHTPGLVSGMTKCAVKASPGVLWNQADQKIMVIMQEKLSRRSKPIINKTLDELELWLKDVPQKEWAMLMDDYHYSGSGTQKGKALVKKRIEQLRKIANELE